MRFVCAVVLGAICLGSACDDGGGPTPIASSMGVNAGNTQVGPAGQALATQLSVIVRDAAHNPMAGVTVTWRASAGGGSVNPATVSTNTSGLAATTRTLGPNAGTQATTAEVSGLPLAIFIAVAQVQGATQIALIGGNNQTDTVLSTLAEPLAVVVQDQNYAGVQGVVVNWTALGGGSVSAATSTTDANGVAIITRTFGTMRGGQLAHATVTGLAGSPVIFTLTATPGVATALAKSGAADSSIAAPSSNVLYTVFVRDAHGNGVGGVTIDWAVGMGGGSIAPAQNATVANGTSTATRTLSAVLGDHTATATAAGLTGSPATFTTTAANVTNVTVGGVAVLAFSPNAVTITQNSVVTWTWATGNTLPHNVTFTPTAGAPANVLDRVTGSASRPFTATGTFNYSCTNHIGMTGSVTVNP